MYLGLKNGVVAVLDFKLIPLLLGACKVHVREAVAAEESVPAYAGYLGAGYVQALERGAALEGVDPYALDVDAESDGLKVAAILKSSDANDVHGVGSGDARDGVLAREGAGLGYKLRAVGQDKVSKVAVVVGYGPSRVDFIVARAVSQSEAAQRGGDEHKRQYGAQFFPHFRSSVFFLFWIRTVYIFERPKTINWLHRVSKKFSRRANSCACSQIIRI